MRQLVLAMSPGVPSAVSDEHVIEVISDTQGDDEFPSDDVSYDDDDVVDLEFNNSDPFLIEDFLVDISIVEREDGSYLVSTSDVGWWNLVLTEEGVNEYAESVLGNPLEVPKYLYRPGASEDVPEWIPDSYEIVEAVRCGECEEEYDPIDMVPVSCTREDGVPYCYDCYFQIVEDR